TAKSGRSPLGGESTVLEGSAQKSRSNKSAPGTGSRSQSNPWGADASVAIDMSNGEIPGWEPSGERPGRESTSSAVARALQRESDSDGCQEGSLSESQTATQAVPELVVQNEAGAPAAAGMVEVKHDQLAEARALPEPPATPWLPRIAIIVLVFGIAAAI